jgi:hypothetical protein
MDTGTLQQVKKEDAVVLLWKLVRGTVREIDPPADEKDKSFLFHQLLTEHGDKGKKFLFFELLKKTGDTFNIPLDPVNYNDKYPWEAHIDTHGGKKWLVALSRIGMIFGKDRWWTEEELHVEHKEEVQRLWSEAENAEREEQHKQT